MTTTTVPDGEDAAGLLAAFLEATDAVVFAKDLDGRYVVANPALERFLGRPADEIRGKRDGELFASESALQLTEIDRRIAESGSCEIYESEIERPDGGPRSFLTTKGVYRDGRGEVLGVFGIAYDITPKKQVERELEKSEERFRKIYEYSNDAIFLLEPDRDRILDANPGACRMLGYTREELLSTPISAIHPDEMPKLLAFARSIAASGHGWTDELRCLTRSGKLLPAEISASLSEIAGRPCIVAMVRDVSARKAAEAALRESEEKLSRIVESAMDAIIICDDSGSITLFNRAAERIFRTPAGEAVGRPLEGFLSGRLAALVGDRRQQRATSLEASSVWVPEGFAGRRSDGEEFPVEATLSSTEASGKRLHTVILRDVGERQTAEALLRKLELENVYLQEEIRQELPFGELVGTSPSIREVFEQIEQVAATDSTVLITGETGTGKELVARAIHERGERRGKVLVKVNCAALPAGLIESELFGHEKGAFTGALNRKIGRFEIANDGTIFLDEIGDLPLELQSKLLRVLQEGELERVGGTSPIPTRVRVIAATNQVLEKAVETGRFRADLYYRLNVFPIRLPSLRERRTDIPLLARHFVMKHGSRLKKRVERIPRAVLAAFEAYSWPGNVRELENVVERAMILSRGRDLEVGPWFRDLDARPGGPGMEGGTLDEAQRSHIVAALSRTGWRVSGKRGAAALLGMKPTTLHARMKKLGIQRSSPTRP